MQDLRLAIRSLRASPIVSLVAVLSLALGIGANTAIFSIVNSLMLRELPVREPDRLAIVTETRGAVAPGNAPWSNAWTFAIWEQIRDRSRLFESTLAYSATRLNLASGGETEFADGLWASGSFFDTLGVQPILGRAFTSDDDRRGGGAAGPVAVISYTFWQRRFGGAADAVGRTLVVERVPFTIVGVTPPDFFGPTVGQTFDVAVPIGCEPLVRGADTSLDQRSRWWLAIMVRLKAGQSIDAGTSALRGVQPQIRAGAARGLAPELDRGFLATPLTLVRADTRTSPLRQRYERPLLAILAVVVLVLLIACANIANLLLARATARRHEFSVQRALGASRWRLVRQLVAEGLVLAAAGAAVGLIVAQWGSRLLVHQLSTQTSTVFLDLSIDWRVLAFTGGVTIATVLLFSVAPAFRVSRVEPMEAIKEQGRGPTSGGRINVAGGLVVVQVAMSVVLVVAAGLFVRTFAALATRHLGFQQSGVLLVTVDTLPANIAPANRRDLFERVRQAVSGVAGVASVALSRTTPVQGAATNILVQVSGGVALPERQRMTFVHTVTPHWFSTYRTPLLAGRDVTEADHATAPHVVVVNEAFARQFLNGANPIGRTVTQDSRFGSAPPNEIVGLAADAVYRDLRAPVPPTMYVPLAQTNRPSFFPSLTVSVRTASGSPAVLTRAVASAIGDVNPQLALTFRSLDEQVSASLTQERMIAMLSGFFGALALLLAGLGLYGVTAYAVSRRRAELGIRMALGAAPRTVVRLVLSRVCLLVAAGVAAGGGVSLWAGKFVGSLLYGLEPRDPWTLIMASGLLGIVGALAGWLPAWRASRIDPAQVLRES